MTSSTAVQATVGAQHRFIKEKTSLAAGKDGAVYEPEVVCDGLSFPEGPIALDDGSVVLVEIAAGLLVRVDLRGRKSVIADLGGGPNGAAVAGRAPLSKEQLCMF